MNIQILHDMREFCEGLAARISPEQYDQDILFGKGSCGCLMSHMASESGEYWDLTKIRNTISREYILDIIIILQYIVGDSWDIEVAANRLGLPEPSTFTVHDCLQRIDAVIKYFTKEQK